MARVGFFIRKCYTPGAAGQDRNNSSGAESQKSGEPARESRNRTKNNNLKLTNNSLAKTEFARKLNILVLAPKLC